MSSFDVNKTIQRATAKAIAMHGLGISLWWKNAEDLSDIKSTETKEAPKKVSQKTPVKNNPTLEDIPDDKMFDMLKYVSDHKHLGFEQVVANIQEKYNVNKEQEKKIRAELKKGGKK